MMQHFDYCLSDCPSTSKNDNQSVRSSVPVVSRWLWPGKMTYLEVASTMVTWWVVAFWGSVGKSCSDVKSLLKQKGEVHVVALSPAVHPPLPHDPCEVREPPQTNVWTLASLLEGLETRAAGPKHRGSITTQPDRNLRKTPHDARENSPRPTTELLSPYSKGQRRAVDPAGSSISVEILHFDLWKYWQS